jgi:hypothetical protein
MKKEKALMTDDLVKRLRQLTCDSYDVEVIEKAKGAMDEAADRIKKLEMQLSSEKALRQSLEETVSIHSQRQNDRIEKLEAALREAIAIVAAHVPSGYPHLRKALEGKDD